MNKYGSATISSLGDLKQFGFNPLTGEACAYNLRLLCDVSQTGIDNFCKFKGLNSVKTHDNWNSLVGEEDAIGSLMLSPEELWELATFCLLEYGWDRVIPHQLGHHTVYAFDMSAPNAEEFERMQSETLRVVRNPHPCFHRNQHQMTGRMV